MKGHGLLFLLLTASLGACPAAQSAKPGGDEAVLAGDWRGDSICQIRPGICHDEKALYRVKARADSPHGYTLDACKMVDGKPELMGSTECTYAPEKRVLTCSTPKIVLNLTPDGKGLNGTMNLPDGTVARKLTLRHD